MRLQKLCLFSEVGVGFAMQHSNLLLVYPRGPAGDEGRAKSTTSGVAVKKMTPGEIRVQKGV